MLNNGKREMVEIKKFFFLLWLMICTYTIHYKSIRFEFRSVVAIVTGTIVVVVVSFSVGHLIRFSLVANPRFWFSRCQVYA